MTAAPRHDDSIVRGTTSPKIVKMLRDAGAREVHVRISCPPTAFPCHYGIDMPTREELIASDHTVEEIRDYIGADSLAYLSLEGTLAGAGGALVVGLAAWATGLVGLAGVGIVALAGIAGSTFESYLGAWFEDKGGVDNEVINFTNTMVGALVAVLLAALV